MKLLITAVLLLSPLAVTAQTNSAPSSMPGMQMPAKPPVPPSSGFTVFLDKGSPQSFFNQTTLQSLPQQTITSVDGHTGKTVTFTGPLVMDVLRKAGFPSAADAHERILHSIVRVTGTDGYFVFYSLTEMEPAFSSGKVIIALEADGKPVESGIQLVNPLDIKPARWVHGLKSLVLTELMPVAPPVISPPK
jgi:hypothetical protein